MKGTRLALGVACLAALAALVACPGAAAHGGVGAALGYTSTITRISPAMPGVSLEILDGDDRLLLTNTGRGEVIVLGYEEEPYLRVTADGVFGNIRSAATYLNDDRYAQADVPETVDPEAPPEWEKIEDEPRAEWHDHRIHWMSTNPPPVVREDPDSPHRILDWEVPLVVDGTDVTVSGALLYEPPDESSFSPILIVPPAFLVLAGSAAWWLRRRKGKEEDPSGDSRS